MFYLFLVFGQRVEYCFSISRNVEHFINPFAHVVDFLALLLEIVEFPADCLVPIVDDGYIYVTLAGPIDKFATLVYDPTSGWVAGATTTYQFIADEAGAADDVIAVRVQRV